MAQSAVNIARSNVGLTIEARMNMASILLDGRDGLESGKRLTNRLA